MTEKIWRAIFLSCTAAIILTTLLITFVLHDGENTRKKAELANELRLAAVGVEQNGLGYLKTLVPRPDEYRLTWVHSGGIVLFDTVAKIERMENHLDREEIKAALASENGDGMAVRESATLTEKTVYIARRLNDGSVLRIAATVEPLPLVLVRLLQPVFIVLALLLILSFAFAHRMAAAILRPVNELDLGSLESCGDRQAAPVYDEIKPIIARLKTQRQQELALQAKRREFTANVSHELKTPLQTIMASAELLANDLVKEEDKPDFAGRIYSEASRLSLLVADIIRLSELDENTAADCERIDLGKIAAETVSHLMPLAEEKGVAISLDAGENIIIDGVPRQIGEIIYNLVENAIKYRRPDAKPQPQVRITVGRKENAPFISVADNGIGIAKENQERIFERFYRVDKSRSKSDNSVSGGTGLGLAIVRHAAEYHHAIISVNSALGIGTAINVQFPVQQL